MGIRVSVDVSGLKLNHLADGMREGVSTAVDETLTAIEQDIKSGASGAPIITGNLRRSYHKTKTGDYSGTVGSDAGVAHYAPYVEFGTSKMSPRPHAIPAMMGQLGPFLSRLKAALS